MSSQDIEGLISKFDGKWPAMVNVGKYGTYSHAAVLAIYLATLLCRRLFITPPTVTLKHFIQHWLLELGLSADELKEVDKALEDFGKFYDENLGKKDPATRGMVLDMIEEKYYEKFKEATYRFYRGTLDPDVGRKLYNTLLRIASKVEYYNKTPKGSFYTSMRDLQSELRECGLDFSHLLQAGIAVIVIGERTLAELTELSSIGIPAPYVDPDFLKLVEGSSPAKIVGASKPMEEHAEAQAISTGPEALITRPSREVLEGIVAKVLEDLGFRVQVDVKLPAKGGELEVDVWGVKNVDGMQFRVYVSCKNWDKDVDRQVVDHEFGRVLQLTYMPHLRVLVAKRLSEGAKKAALDDGFFVIELEEKASTANAQEVYEVISRKLRSVFMGIAPQKLREVAEKLKKLAKEVEEVI